MALRHPNLGFYTLAGAPESPRDLIAEIIDAERLGLGTAFISERFNIKEAATLSGAAGAVSTEIDIITAATNHNTRHPIVTASYATTMHRLTGGRFSLGIGRGIAPMFKAFGLPPITTAQMEDFAVLMRRLWRGETVIGHDGPIGSYPVLRLDPTFDEDIPLSLVAFGPNSLELGGRVFDNVILHTFFTDFTTQRFRVRHTRLAAKLSLSACRKSRENGRRVRRRPRAFRTAKSPRSENHLRHRYRVGRARPRKWLHAQSG